MPTRVALGLELLAKKKTNCKVEGLVANLKVCDLELGTNVDGFSYWKINVAFLCCV